MSTHESENWVGKSKQVWRHPTIHTIYSVGALFHSATAAATTQPRPTPIDTSIRVRKYLTLSNAHIYMKIEIEKMATKK